MNLHADRSSSFSVEDVKAKFPGIKFRMQWDKLGRWRAPVHLIDVQSTGDLLELRTAFRMRWGRVPPGFLKTIGSHFMTVREAVENFDKLQPRRRRIIETYVEEFSQMGGAPDLRIPTYHLRSGRQLILDANHRACALAIADVPFKLTLVSIAGPWYLAPK